MVPVAVVPLRHQRYRAGVQYFWYAARSADAPRESDIPARAPLESTCLP